MNVKIIVTVKKIICICENSKYLKSVADTSVTNRDEIVVDMNNLWTKKTNTITTNVTSMASITCHNKKIKRDCYILHTVLLVIILLVIIIIIWYHYAKQRGII